GGDVGSMERELDGVGEAGVGIAADVDHLQRGAGDEVVDLEVDRVDAAGGAGREAEGERLDDARLLGSDVGARILDPELGDLLPGGDLVTQIEGPQQLTVAAGIAGRGERGERKGEGRSGYQQRDSTDHFRILLAAGRA